MLARMLLAVDGFDHASRTGVERRIVIAETVQDILD
jgi:hypothetical protein